jgi:hypothetical protein
MDENPHAMPGWDDVATALALLKAAMTGDSEGVATLMAVVGHRSLVVGLLAVAMQMVERGTDQPEQFIAALQHALVSEKLEG